MTLRYILNDFVLNRSHSDKIRKNDMILLLSPWDQSNLITINALYLFFFFILVSRCALD